MLCVLLRRSLTVAVWGRTHSSENCAIPEMMAVPLSSVVQTRRSHLRTGTWPGKYRLRPRTAEVGGTSQELDGRQ